MDKQQFEDAVKSIAADVFTTQKEELNRKYAEVYEQSKAEEAKKGQKPIEPGIRLARFAKCAMLSGGDPEKAKDIAEKRFNDKETANYFDKALSVSVGASGGFTVPEVLNEEIIPILYNSLATEKLGMRRLPMPNGNISIPRGATSSTAYYVGENKKITKSEGTFGQVKLSSKKLAALVPISNDLLISPSSQADMFIRDDMLNVLRVKLDYTAFYGTGVEDSPKGISNQIVSGNILGSSTTAMPATTLSTILGKLLTNNVPMIAVGWAMGAGMWSYLYGLRDSAGWVFRDEMQTGKLLGYPFVVSTNVSTTAGSPGYGDIFCGDFSELLMAVQSDMELSVSNTASYTDGASTYSAFENDQTVMRVISRHDFAVRHDVSFVKGTYKFAAS